MRASFAADGSVVAEGPRGQLGHREHLAHGERFATRLHAVRPGVWTFVGNGLSNQTFVEGPGGLIAIDTGECVEEMAAALRAVRAHTEAPVVAVIYTHFHYVAGTTALASERQLDGLDVWAHALVPVNRQRTATEVSAAYGRGLLHQFGLALPADGPDGLTNVGLGLGFRNPDHAPYTPGYVAPTRTFDAVTTETIAGLDVELAPAPSDADDSITIWFPELGVCVNNLVWPALFNVFPIRGEEYRDPRVLLDGLDHVLGLHAEHLVGAHGPPLSGVDEIAAEVTRYRDSIQFLWDQTVRGLNRGLTDGELADTVRLPDAYDDGWRTRQWYGVAEHHVRQIRSGLVGWFDGDESRLFPLPPGERCRRLIVGFGGRAEVARQARQAIDDDDLRWALELATWLVRADVDDADDDSADGGEVGNELLAEALRTVARRTTAANIRNWCLTRARELDGSLDLGRHRRHRIPHAAVLAGDPAAFVHTLRVLLDPTGTAGLDVHLAFDVATASGTVTAGLHLRHSVAVPTGGDGAAHRLRLDHATLADVLAGRLTLADGLASDRVAVDGDADAVTAALGHLDHPSFR